MYAVRAHDDTKICVDDLVPFGAFTDGLTAVIVDARAAQSLRIRAEHARQGGKCLAALPDTSIIGMRVARELLPSLIVSDNDAELTSRAVLA
jgi:hypothetical protein